MSGIYALPAGLRRVFLGRNETQLHAFMRGTLKPEEVTLLMSELLKGETLVGEDTEGELLRVVCVAKPIILDAACGELLVELMHTKMGSASEGLKIKATGMSEKFNPLKESSRQACARALQEELGFAEAAAEMFCGKCMTQVESAPSDKYAGLKSQYHLHMHMLKPSVVAELLTGRVPRGQLTRVDEADAFQPRSIWWIWIAPRRSEHEINDHVRRLSASAGVPSDALPLDKLDKFGKSPAGTMKVQMDLASSYLEYLMSLQ